MSTNYTDAELIARLDMLEDCEKRSHLLNEWEQGFIDSLEQCISKGNTPSLKQIEKLDQIWEKVTK